MAFPVLRVARPTDNLDKLLRFYRDGLGLDVLYRFEGHDGFDGVMLWRNGAPYHFEFTRKRGHPAGRAPTQDNLLVFYHTDAADWRAAVRRMRDTGIAPVPAFNPYWDRNGVTFEDPDGYRIVLQNAAWAAEPRLPMFSIRLATLGDARCFPDVERSAGEAFRATPHAWIVDAPDIVPEAPEVYRPWIGAGGVRVTEVDGVVAGFIAAAPLGQALHIHVLAVHHHHQRQGIGTALLAATRIAAAEQGFGEMTLTTFANVSFNAPFYARLGFRIEPAPPAPLAAILNAEARRGLTDRCAMRAVFRL